MYRIYPTMFNGFMPSPFEIGAAISFASDTAPPFLWNGATAVGRMVGDWPPGFFSGRFGAVSSYIDILLAQRGIGREDAPAKRKDVPPGTDSPNYGTRGARYLDEWLSGRELPSTDDVLHNLLGPSAKKQLGEERYKFLKREEKDKDNILRTLTKDVIGKWMDNEVARSEFARRWVSATTDAQRIRILLDPNDDGSAAQNLMRMFPELQGEKDEDRLWERAIDLLNTKLGLGTLIEMGNTVLAHAQSRGVSQTAGVDREKASSDLMKKGYTEAETKTIVSAFKTDAEARSVIKRLDDQRQNQTQIEQYELRLKGGAKGKDKTAVEGELKKLKEERARQFLRDLASISEWRYGRKLEDMGFSVTGPLPTGVKDVQTAAQWFYGRLGQGITIAEDGAEAGSDSTAKKKGGVVKKTTPKEKTAEARNRMMREINKKALMNEINQRLSAYPNTGQGFTIEFTHEYYTVKVVFNKSGIDTKINKILLEEPVSGEWIDATSFLQS